MNKHLINLTDQITITVWENPETGRCWGQFNLPITPSYLGDPYHAFDVAASLEDVKKMLRNPAEVKSILIEYLKWLGGVQAVLDAQTTFVVNQMAAVQNEVLDG